MLSAQGIITGRYFVHRISGYQPDIKDISRISKISAGYQGYQPDIRGYQPGFTPNFANSFLPKVIFANDHFCQNLYCQGFLPMRPFCQRSNLPMRPICQCFVSPKIFFLMKSAKRLQQVRNTGVRLMEVLKTHYT